jgi:tetratricopeptide (TPR) repeat protein
MSDEIRRLSEELARDPESRAFLQLGETLRRSGQTELAHRVALRGLERHPHDAEAHDLLARIHVDRDALEDALDEWDMVLRIAPEHVGARKGIGYVLFKQGRLPDAERYLGEAAAQDPADASIATALRMVRRTLQYANETNGDGVGGEDHNGTVAAAQRRVEEEARTLFASILGDGEQTALLLDGEGLVTAGAYITAEGRDVAQEVGAALAGVRDEVDRVVRHLDLGQWRALTYETDVARVAMAPVLDDSVVLLAAAPSVPLGLVRRVVDWCARRATTWLEEVA